MKQYTNLVEAADYLGDGGPYAPDTAFNNVEEYVDALIATGNSEEIFAQHDDHLGLKEQLSEAFLMASLDEADQQKYQDQREAVLEQTNIILDLADKLA